jgi:hypothetical protein
MCKDNLSDGSFPAFHSKNEATPAAGVTHYKGARAKEKKVR